MQQAILAHLTELAGGTSPADTIFVDADSDYFIAICESLPVTYPDPFQIPEIVC